MDEIVFDFTKRKPVKCVHCRLDKGQHRAQTFQCPAKWSRRRAVGYTHFLETVFTPPPTGADGVEVPRG